MRYASGAFDAVMLVAAAAFAVFGTDFVLFEVSEVLTMAIAIVGLMLLVEINGQFSLGHGAFLAVGAYATAISVSLIGLPVFIATLIGCFAAFGAGLFIGIPALRLEGLHLAIATFVVGIATPILLKLSALEPWTGGVQGIYLDKLEAPFGISVSPDRWTYLVVVLVAVCAYLAVLSLIHSRSGRALRAIRENATASAALGIDVGRYKILAFAFSAALTGLAGSLNAIVVQFVSPDAFGVQLSISLVVGLVIGNLAGLRGALLGALFIVLLPNAIEQFTKGLAGVVFGVILIAVTCLMPTLRGRFLAR